MKQFKQFLLVLLVALTSSVTASAYDFEVDGIYYNTISLQDLTCEVTYKLQYKTTYSGDIVIPSTVTYSGKSFSVTKIGHSAFWGCSSLTSVEIGNSITSIGHQAFSSCTSLTSLKIPNSVTSIGNNAFNGCSGLTSVTIPNSVTEIGVYAFSGCKDLTSVTIPSSVTSIGDCAFKDCTSLTSVEIPNSVTSIGDGTFSSCTSLISVEIPNSVTLISNFAFRSCTSLTSIKIPNSVTLIRNSAFLSCHNLKEITSLAITPPNIYGDTFKGVSKTETVLKVPAESVAAYQASEYWKEFWNIVGLNGEGGEGSDDEPETKQCTAPTIELVNGKLVATSATEGAKCYTSIKTDDYKDVTGNEPIELTGVYNISSYAFAEGYKNSETVTATLIWVNPTLKDGDTEPETKKCAAPTIELVDGKLAVTSATEGAKCRTSITSDDKKGVTGNEPIELTGVYNLTSYAHAEGYQNSETVTATLVWVNPTLEDSGVMSMEAKKAVLIRTQGGSIIVSGTERGEGIQLYGADGRQLCSVSAEDGQTVIPCNAGKGEVVIVKIGQKTVEVAM